jgi:hypothetical protein
MSGEGVASGGSLWALDALRGGWRSGRFVVFSRSGASRTFCYGPEIPAALVASFRDCLDERDLALGYVAR